MTAPSAPPSAPFAPATESGSARGMPLALRLALVLSAAVLIVLLLAGAVVNRVVTRGFEDVVITQQQEQVEAAAEALSSVISQGGNLREAGVVLDRLARSLNGPVTIFGPNGTQIASFGPRVPPDGETVGLDAPVIVNGEQVGTVTAIVPAQGQEERPFLRLFNVALLVAGLVSLLAIAGVSVWFARRQTRPLQDVAAAASRLGAGDLTARATGGGDRESQELASAFNAMAGRLESSEMLRRRAATDMAHDLTPATVLQTQLQAMIDGVVPKSRPNLEAAAASAAALGSVVVQMGELASAEAAPLQARCERVEVAAVLAEAASALDGLYRERGVTLQLEPTAPDLDAWADPAHLGRALRNVMTNAAQHTPTGKTVRVAATHATAMTDTAPTHRVQIRVTDEGPGIPAEDLPHVFERFYRSDPARSAQPGIGIGLTIARDVLAPSGGSISVERTGPDGTTLLISLAPD